MSITLLADTKDIEILLDGLKLVPAGLETATARALNKSIVSTRAEGNRVLRKDYNMKAKDINAIMKVKKATRRNLEARLTGESSPGIPLYKFSPTPKRVPSTKRLKDGGYNPKGGIRVIVRKAKGRRVVQGAFIARMKSGHVGVFRRTEQVLGGRSMRASKLGRRYIKELYGPSPVRVLSGDRYDEHLEDYADEQMEKNLTHESKFILQKAGLI